jgi:hypothetical protein
MIERAPLRPPVNGLLFDDEPTLLADNLIAIPARHEGCRLALWTLVARRLVGFGFRRGFPFTRPLTMWPDHYVGSRIVGCPSNKYGFDRES